MWNIQKSGGFLCTKFFQKSDWIPIAILAGVVKNIDKETNRQERQGRKDKKEKRDI
ncbi:hypothetical protein [Nostoc sp. CHAB 5715]|uniref:hypothetical protein n=1 Tax=Nostoc sp. CHAB 5715 TaxID=2780400 RepID=UPI001E58CAD1|nr:hypothetical protein [Nostoc sp. CHAB 5715]MCC5623615.1 hypothetical protein [Nostoc sp. CHAB 5715]